MKGTRAGLLVAGNHRLTGHAVQTCFKFFRNVMFLRDLSEEAIGNLQADVIISFLSPRILTGVALANHVAINFHPAPPCYPGRGGAAFALYNKDAFYGATAHLMAEKVDAGRILMTENFTIDDKLNAETVFSMAEDASLSLLQKVLAHRALHECLPVSNEQWAGPASTRKQFEQWLLCDASDPEEVTRKVRAAKHSRYPGPYIMVGDHRFVYDGSIDDKTQT